MILSEFQIIKDVCEKPRNKPVLKYERCNFFNFQIPTLLGLRLKINIFSHFQFCSILYGTVIYLAFPGVLTLQNYLVYVSSNVRNMKDIHYFARFADIIALLQTRSTFFIRSSEFILSENKQKKSEKTISRLLVDYICYIIPPIIVICLFLYSTIHFVICSELKSPYLLLNRNRKKRFHYPDSVGVKTFLSRNSPMPFNKIDFAERTKKALQDLSEVHSKNFCDRNSQGRFPVRPSDQNLEKLNEIFQQNKTLVELQIDLITMYGFRLVSQSKLIRKKVLGYNECTFFDRLFEKISVQFASCYLIKLSVRLKKRNCNLMKA